MNNQQYISLTFRWNMLVDETHNAHARDPSRWTQTDLRNLVSCLTFNIAWFDGAAAMAKSGSEEEHLAASLGLLAVNALNECREMLKDA